MQGPISTIDEAPKWLSKILLDEREWPVYASEAENDFKCAACYYIPEYFIKKI